MSDRYNYTIDENNAVSIFDSENPNENGAPSIFQPYDPAKPNVSWTKEEAEKWAKTTIENFSLPAVPWEPPYIAEVKRIMEENPPLDTEEAEVV